MSAGHIITLPETDSTSTALAALDAASPLPHMTAMRAVAQSAGRGQRGNSWESAPGANLTFSVVLRPHGVGAAEQFRISEAVSLAVARALDPLVPTGVEVSVKWPNDVYAGDLKICGILIENTLCGAAVERSIAGIGVNVNQRKFLSDAPNPVSLTQLTGKTHDIEALMRSVLSGIEVNLLAPADELHTTWLSRLWRRTGVHPFRDAASGVRFDASVVTVTPAGQLVLAPTAPGSEPYSTYSVKGVAWL